MTLPRLCLSSALLRQRSGFLLRFEKLHQNGVREHEALRRQVPAAGGKRGVFPRLQPQRVTVLDYAFLSTITEKAVGTVIYADRSSISEDKLAKMGVTFKKIPRDISRL